MKKPPYVYLCGAGPGAADLLTMRAHRLLTSGEADCLMYDDLAGDETLTLAHPRMERIFSGKRCGRHSMTQAEINERLVTEALSGKTVLRLKGGDPCIFGRIGEEIAALKAAGVPFEVVPGVTGASSAAASARTALTLRGAASSLRLVTGHGRDGEIPDFRRLADPSSTLAIYMGLGAAPRICAELIEGGLDPATPCLAVSRASLPDERLLRSRLDRLAEDVRAGGLEAPALLLAGSALAES